MLRFVPAKMTDSTLILEYIKDLAIAEKFPFQVSATLADIEKNLLGENATAKAVILYPDEK